MSTEKRDGINPARRSMLKAALGGGALVAGGNALPERWIRPVVQAVIVPAHAQLSTCGDCVVRWEQTFFVCGDVLNDWGFDIQVQKDGSAYSCFQITSVPASGGTSPSSGQLFSANNSNFGERIEPGIYRILVRIPHTVPVAGMPNLDLCTEIYIDNGVVCCSDDARALMRSAGRPPVDSVLRSGDFVLVGSFEITPDCRFVK